jgi:hypothetical protein
VVAIFDNVLPNQTLTIPKNARHIWCFAPRIVNFLKIKLNDRLDTKC